MTSHKLSKVIQQGDQQLKTTNVCTVTRKVFFFECFTILLVIAVIWSNELFDIPFLLFGANPTPVNWHEAIFESVLILCVGTLGIAYNRKILLKINKVADVIPTCASCHRIYDDDEFWNILREGANQYCQSQFVDGICMGCLKKYSPEVYTQHLEEIEKQQKTALGR